MSEQKHTPGPWQVEPNFDVYYADAIRDYNIIADAGGYSQQVARVWFCGGGAVSHNAALIAAAPQLLEACKMWLSQRKASHRDIFVATDDEIAEAMEAAIEAAEGES